MATRCCAPLPPPVAPRLTTVDLEAGALEMSNSSALAGIMSMVTATRQFDMHARVIEAFSNVDKRAATDIARR